MIFKIALTSLKEQLQKPGILLLTLFTAPLFVCIYALLFPATEINFNIGIVSNNNTELVYQIKNYSLNDSDPLFNVFLYQNKSDLEHKISNKAIDLGIVIPQDFEESVKGINEGNRTRTNTIQYLGDMSHSSYSPAAVLSHTAIEAYVFQRTDSSSPLSISEEFLGKSQNLSDFDFYIPGLLIFSVIILIFQVAMNLSSLVESGIHKRLRLSRATAFQIICGYSIPVICIGTISFGLTLITAILFGTQLSGNWFAIGAIAMLCILAISATAMIISAFTETSNSAFIIANVPMMLFMFLSGTMFPIQSVILFESPIGSIGLFDILPTTHGVKALHKLLILDGNWGDITYELGALLVLTLLFTWIGTRLYYTRKMK